MHLRVKIQLPESKPLWQNSFSIRAHDLNYGNHLGNDRALVYAQELRLEWLHHHGLSELSCLGPGLIQADAMVMYRSQGHYSQKITGKMWGGEVNHSYWDIFYQFTCEDQELLRIKTGMVFYDYEARKISSPAPQFIKLINSLQSLN